MLPLAHPPCIHALTPNPTRELKHKHMVSAAMARHGLKSVSSAKARRLAEAAEEEAAETLELEAARANAHEASVDPGQLAGARAAGVPGDGSLGVGG